jgi:hypothetical protein
MNNGVTQMAYTVFKSNGEAHRFFVADVDTIEAARVLLREMHAEADVFHFDIDPSPVDDAADCFVAYSGTLKSFIFTVEPKKG